MLGEAVVQEDGKDRFGGGVDGFFGGAVIGEEAWEKEYGGTQTDMLRFRRRDGGCRPGKHDGRRWDQHEKQTQRNENTKHKTTGKQITTDGDT